MAEQHPLESEIIQTVTVMHDAVVDAWQKDEFRASPLAYASTVTPWHLDIGRGCSLTITEEHLGKYRPHTAPFEAYTERDKQIALPLHVDLPHNRKGVFSLVVSKHDICLHDEYPDDTETLSRIGLLTLMGASEPADLFKTIERATQHGDAVKQSVHRTILTMLPINNRWPGLCVEDTTTQDGTVTTSAKLDVFLERHRKANGTPLLTFEGIVADTQNGKEVLEYTYMDTREMPTATEVTPVRLERIGSLALKTLDIVYGHGCQRLDRRRLGLDVTRNKTIGLDGKPSIYAQFGYDFALETQPLLENLM